MFSTETSNEEDAGVFGLISKLCTITASKYCCSNRISQTKLASKMRSLSYEIILRKTTENIPTEGDPIVHLLSVSFISHQNVKNTAEYRRTTELKDLITTLINTDFGDKQENVNNILKFILGLKNSVKDDFGNELFLKPFTFGLLDKMLPRPPPEPFGSPDPYPYYPSHIFNLPFSLKKHDASYLAQKTSQSYTEYNVETFESKFLTSTEKPIEIKSYLSPMSLQSITSTTTPLIDFSIFNYPKLTGPRDLQIPSEIQSEASNVKVSPPSTYEGEVEEVFRAHSQSFDIWELATQVDKNIPDDIWETVAKLPLMTERQLIASSPREMRLWREMYRHQMNDFKVISERRFIRHIKYLCIGVETNSFPFNKELNSFYTAEDLILEGISRNCLRGYMVDLLITGTYYKRLFNFAFNQNSEDHFEGHGLVYEAAREVIRRYLLEFRLKSTAIYEEYCKNSDNGVTCMPTLLQILSHMEPLKREIETIASIFKMIDAGECSLPYGADLMSYLFNEISLVTHHSTAAVMFNSLYSICQVYFKFIEKFIFEGELEDAYNEFFIRKDSQYVNLRSKRYWDKGYHIAQSVSVPEFLRSLAKFILLCGKSLRLLKMCNPSDPLVHLISSDHPSVKCCASFEELEHQQELLNVYRTRCMFVTGELVTFDQILLKREAERKAFTEMATLKQAETLEKIVAERKRLAQLIIAEKQHSLRVLEAAMAEAKAAKLQSKMRERKRFELEERGDRATEEVDSLIRDDEKHKIMEYYSKLNMEVEKKQQHTEWKIKRLQLDESRMQLLSTEERNLKREKLELEHKRNEGNPSEMSTRDETSTNNESERDGMIPNTDEKVIDDVSDAGKVVRFHGKVRYENKDDIDLNKVDGNTDQNDSNEVKSDPMTESTNSVVMLDMEENRKTEFKDNKKRAQSSRDTFINICQVAKNFFGSKKGDKSCDNIKQLDAQGNIINEEENSNTKTEVSSTSKVSSDVIGGHLTSFDSGQFLRLKLEAVQNKMKVMHNEFGQDIDNNKKSNTTSVDNENNLEWSPFEEAKKNKLKVLGDEFGLLPQVKVIREPVTDAHKEALINKQRVLGVEYNMPVEVFRKEPANIAQEEAIRNKKKMMAADCETITSPKRAVLTLNLKSCEVDIFKQYPSNPVTPGELFTALDLETPTTADVPLDGAVTSEIFTPRSDYSKDEVLPKSKEYLSAEGFNFPLIPDVAYSEAASDGQTDVSPESSPSKLDIRSSKSKLNYSFFNLLDGTYSLDEFDPFGVRQLGSYSGNYFSSKMDLDMSNASYTHPAVIMDEVKKAPYTNIFTGHYENEDRDAKINCYNIATLTACLQRSVMLPLTYQLEVVNNSILTYFLVNLDMYEHLRSLKDYFFLMDGEFSRSICHNLFTKLTKTLNPQELLNFATLHNILDKALGSSISHVHKFSENLSFTIADTPLSFQHSSPDVLQCLSLTYSVDWPLNIILSQEALLRYAKVFQFLVKMRRIFWVLGEDFENLKLAAKLSKHHSRKLLRSPQYISVQIYRHIMASMIRALDNYIVTTCILSSWTEFETDLKKARTLDDLYECHVVYIKKVLFRCLLNNRSTPVMKLLNDIFTVILKFSRVLKAGEWHQKQPNGKFTHTSFSQLQELYYLFEKLAKYLHKVVTKLMECGYQRHLVELLTMVNLNKYYDVEKPKEKEDQNNSLVGK